jgi:hypothetical protein
VSPDDHSLVQTSRDRLCDLWDAEGLGDSDGVFSSALDNVPPKASAMPAGPKGIFLSKLVLNKGLYKSFLAMILGGAQVKAAAESVGVPPNHVQYWLASGNTHFQQGKDSWYSRFYYDVLRAKGMARASAQARAKALKPLQWLQNDADNKGWSEEPLSGVQVEMYLEPQEQVEEEESVFDPTTIAEAFTQLHKMGALPAPQVLVDEALKQEGVYDYGKEEAKPPAADPNA